jgi:hypothetical protein
MAGLVRVMYEGGSPIYLLPLKSSGTDATADSVPTFQNDMRDVGICEYLRGS